MKRIYIGGTFDVLHPGHVMLLERAHALGRTIVSLNTDAFAARYKRAPIMSLAERKIVVGACRYVDEVMVNYGCEDSKPSILYARATHVLHGSDWTGPALMAQMGLTQRWLEAHGIEMLYLDYTVGVSTTDILKRTVTI